MKQLVEEEEKGKTESNEGEKFLYQLNKVLYKFNTTKLDHELVSKIGQYSQKILEKRRKAKPQPVRSVTKKEQVSTQPANKLTGSPSDIIFEYDESMESSLRKSTQLKKAARIKPSHLKNLNAVFTSTFLAEVNLHSLSSHRICCTS